MLRFRPSQPQPAADETTPLAIGQMIDGAVQPSHFFAAPELHLQWEPPRTEDVAWDVFPAFPSSARLAVLVGAPSLPGPYVIRVKVPHGVRFMPHRHPEEVHMRLVSRFNGKKMRYGK